MPLLIAHAQCADRPPPSHPLLRCPRPVCRFLPKQRTAVCKLQYPRMDSNGRPTIHQSYVSWLQVPHPSDSWRHPFDSWRHRPIETSESWLILPPLSLCCAFSWTTPSAWVGRSTTAGRCGAHLRISIAPAWPSPSHRLPTYLSARSLLSVLCSLLSALCSLLSALCSLLLLSALCALLSALCYLLSFSSIR